MGKLDGSVYLATEYPLTKGGDSDDAAGRRCICNGLLAAAGHPHAMKGGGLELPLVTSGTRLDFEQFLGGIGCDYDANAVIDRLGMPISLIDLD